VGEEAEEFYLVVDYGIPWNPLKRSRMSCVFVVEPIVDSGLDLQKMQFHHRMVRVDLQVRHKMMTSRSKDE